MTLASRLLMAGTGSGSFAHPAASGFEVAASPNGGWPGAEVTNAVWYNGWTYVSSIDGSGNLEVRAIQDGSTTAATAVQLAPFSDWLEVDWHDAQALIVRESDHKLVAMYCRHDADANFYRSISTTSLDTDPDLSDGFAAASNVGGSLGGTGFTYPRLHKLSAESNKLYLFWRSYVSGFATLFMSTSTDGGVTWASRTALFRQNAESYWSTDSNDSDRIDIAITDGTAGTSSVYHFYLTGGARYKSDGTSIAGSLPLGTADVTLAYSGAVKGARYVYSVATNGGLPVITFPVDYPSVEDYVYAAWSGSAWASHTIVSAGHSGDPWIEGGCALDRTDVTRVYASVYSGGQWQVFAYSTADGGSTWTTAALTATADASVYPIVPRDHGAWIKVLWMDDGTASSYTSYSFGIGASG